MTVVERVPDVWGGFPGWLRETVAFIAVDVLAVAGLVAIPGGVWGILRD